ncbi:MAG: hypothetical protein KW788_01190 [Candidatus Doudnabacteria bacterium]|nr:hypothetical protein [Candidatus Doudnabacteria bacterium]
MTTKQKIWFAIGLAMFLIPELIWGPVSSYDYQLLNPNHNLLRVNRITDSGHILMTFVVLVIQLIGLIFIANNMKAYFVGVKWFRWFIFLLSFNCLLLIYMAIAIRNRIG